MLKKMAKAKYSYFPRNINLKLLCGHNDCKYTGLLGNKTPYCNYIEVAGHKRPCKPTPNCICYEKGERKQRVEQLVIAHG